MKQEKILILAKTYPVPSKQYSETTCVAGINEDGEMRRLYPIQFRFMDGEQQFKKWQWIIANIQKATKDNRPESYIINHESIECGSALPTDSYWQSRRRWIEKIPVFDTFESLQRARQEKNITLALIRPYQMLELELTAEKEARWTKEELQKLIQDEQQGDLFKSPQHKKRPILEKLPYAFHYRYLTRDINGQELEERHKIIDWEVGQLYRRCAVDYKEKWESHFRAKIEEELFSKELMLMLGTIHRFPDQWLIISLIYPPKEPVGYHKQYSLF